MVNFFSFPRTVGILHSEACLIKLAEEKSDLRKAGIDLLEVRLDSLPNTLQKPKKWALPAIATARDPKEGGSNNLSLTQRQQLLEAALPWASMIDIELQSAQDFTHIIDRAHETQRSLIFSHHDFQATPSLASLEELVHRASDFGATILKIATWTSSEEELERLLEFQQRPHPLPVTTMGMGPLGKKSRPLLAEAGAKLLYGYLYEPLSYAPASMQWSARELSLKKLKAGR